MARMQCLHRVFGGLFCLFLVVQSSWAGQSEVRSLRVEVIEGDRVRNIIGQTQPEPMIVRVLDQNNRPVAAATVMFTAPESGPGGDFPNGSQTLITATDQDGRAAAQEYRANLTEGVYQIQVLARYVVATAIARIEQRNVAPGASSTKVLRILAVAGAAAGTAFALSKRGSGGTSGNSPNPVPTPTIPTITLGGSTVGAPQ
jgi:hypothetical protein